MNSLTKKQSLFEKPAFAYTIAILCTFLWGSAFPSIKLGYELFSISVDDTASKLVFAGLRFTLAGLLVLTLRFIINRVSGNQQGKDEFRHITKKQWGRIALLGIVQTTILYFFFYISLSYVSGAKGSIINSMSVFFSALFAHFFFNNDKMTRKKSLGIILGFLSVILVNYEPGLGFDVTFQGEGFMIIAALLTSLAFVMSKYLTSFASPMLITGCQLTFGGSVLLILALIFGGSFPVGPPSGYFLLLYMATLSATAFSLWTTLLKHHKVSSITIYHFLIPIIGTFLSVLILGEKVFQIQYLLALPSVALGIYLVNKR